MEFTRKRQSIIIQLLPSHAIERIMEYQRWDAGSISIRLRGDLNNGLLKTKTRDRKF